MESDYDRGFSVPEGQEHLFERGALLDVIQVNQETIKSLEETLEFYRARLPLSSSMVFWAFRYCLGRSTDAVMDCVDYLILYWDRIPEATRDQIVKEIFEACGKKDCEIEMDKSQWHRVLEKVGLKYTKSNGWRKEELCITNQSGSKS